MPELLIQITKRADGSVLLRCVRADGSATWQRQEGTRARHFSLHDLAHYAFETELGHRRGFFGLIAEGWDIADTGGRGARGPLPAEALAVEYAVGALDVERASGDAVVGAAAFNEHAALFAATRGDPAPRAYTDAELARVRERTRALHDRWRLLPVGATLELPFEHPPGAS